MELLSWKLFALKQVLNHVMSDSKAMDLLVQLALDSPFIPEVRTASLCLKLQSGYYSARRRIFLAGKGSHRMAVDDKVLLLSREAVV